MPELVMLPTQGSGTAQGVSCKGVVNGVCGGGMYCYAEGTPQVACIKQGMLGAGNPMGGGSKPGSGMPHVMPPPPTFSPTSPPPPTPTFPPGGVNGGTSPGAIVIPGPPGSADPAALAKYAAWTSKCGPIMISGTVRPLSSVPLPCRRLVRVFVCCS
jgi:hypothetical protein